MIDGEAYAPGAGCIEPETEDSGMELEGKRRLLTRRRLIPEIVDANRDYA